ncbi:WD40 repeat-like protein [Backusella circina FSU 941]|nr:WD40 repeat-like protein [Backusella circina FSU 941]
MIEIFDILRPGSSDSTKFATIPKRKSKKGQKGIISCIDFSPDYSGLFAAGSYSKSIGIYDESNNELCLKLTGMDGGGVTQVKFSKDGSLLFSTSRHANTIQCWDIRDTANVLYELPRPGKTNQRISFDIDATGQFLATGDQYGNALFYDIGAAPTDDENRDRLVHSFKAHQDLSSCVAFNPIYPVIASCSGQRKFELPRMDDDSDNESDDDESDDEDDDEIIIDNTLKAWRVPGQYQWFGYDHQNEETTIQQ